VVSLEAEPLSPSLEFSHWTVRKVNFDPQEVHQLKLEVKVSSPTWLIANYVPKNMSADTCNECYECQIDNECPRTLKCDPVGKFCYECDNNSDCKSPFKPFCSTQRACAQCISDDYCKNTSDISTCLNTCIDNQCVSDETDACHNPMMKYCDIENRSCFECKGDNDCAESSAYCNTNGKCVKCITDEQCRSNDDCAATCANFNCQTSSLMCSHCNTTTGICLDCVTNEHCVHAPNLFCVENKCKSCVLDIHCRNNSYCNSMCEDNECIVDTILSCQEIGQTCDTTLGTCFECSPQIKCSSFLYSCSSGTCVVDLKKNWWVIVAPVVGFIMIVILVAVIFKQCARSHNDDYSAINANT